MSGLQLVSLFAGVGGIDLAAELNGIPTVAAVEIDDAARGVLAHRFPDTTLFTDVRGVTGDDLRAAGAVPERTILAGGFPCQPFSVAGRRQGVGDEQGRGDLFWEIDRLLAEFAPAWVVLENVPGLLSIDAGRTMGAILRDLGERGYGVAYRVLDSQRFGVPQRRRRVVIVGRLGDSGAAPVSVLLEPEGGGGDSAPRLPAWPRAAGRAAGGADGAGRIFPALRAGNSYNNSDAGMEASMLVHASASVGFRAADHGSFTEGVGPLTRRYDKDGKEAVIVTALTSNMAGAGGGVDDNTAQGGHLVPYVTQEEQCSFASSSTVRRLTPVECERLQGFPDGWTAHRVQQTGKDTGQVVPQADSHRYRQMGNAVTVDVFAWVLGRLRAHHEGWRP